MTAATPLAPNLRVAFEEKYPGVQIQEAYGLTEHSCITLTRVDTRKRHPMAKKNSVRFTLPNLEIGFRYGSLVEDHYTGYQLHCEGWKSLLISPQLSSSTGQGFLLSSPIWLSEMLTLLSIVDFFEFGPFQADLILLASSSFDISSSFITFSSSCSDTTSDLITLTDTSSEIEAEHGLNGVAAENMHNNEASSSGTKKITKKRKISDIVSSPAAHTHSKAKILTRSSTKKNNK